MMERHRAESRGDVGGSLRDGRARALVVGLGIAGIASAIALDQAGWDVTIIEKAPARRRGGYFIGLFPLGRHAAERLGALDAMHNRRGKHSENLQIDRNGILGTTLGFANTPSDVGPWMMLRGDVEQATFDALPDRVEIRYSTRPQNILQNSTEAIVTCEESASGKTSQESFDLVVGADGIRSQVREIVFGASEKYIRPMNHMICAFELPANPPGLRPDQGVILTEKGRAFQVFPFEDHPATVLFTYRTDDPRSEWGKPAAQRLREVYGPGPYGTYMDYALSVLDEADEYIFDTADQVHMPRWHQGRVVLVGDAAWCPTLYSGMGATSAIGGADLLGAALRKHSDDIDAALEEWETILRPHIESFQRQGITGRTNFVVHDEKERIKRERRIAIFRRLLKSGLARRLLLKMPRFKQRGVDLVTLL
ncbi:MULTISPECIES: FAD-dependent monooxygenase [Streptomyces]|uniref:FAD-dependent monooxygenase n=1 Tax=Streptomyces TaxID=1883 RepID=UPI0033D8115C